jgi:hypothetical protein
MTKQKQVKQDNSKFCCIKEFSKEKHLSVVGVIKVFKEIQAILETGEWFIIDFESSLFILYIKILYFCASNNLVSYFAFIYLIYNTNIVQNYS